MSSCGLQAVVPYLSATVDSMQAQKVALDVLSHFFKEMQEKTRVVEEEEEGEDLCDCEFSLAYGTVSVPAVTWVPRFAPQPEHHMGSSACVWTDGLMILPASHVARACKQLEHRRNLLAYALLLWCSLPVACVSPHSYEAEPDVWSCYHVLPLACCGSIYFFCVADLQVARSC